MKYELTILIVDDEPGIIDVIGEILTNTGYDVTTARDARQAFDFLSRNKVDLILCDIVMPDMDGHELLRKVKQQYPDIGVIMMTGHGNAELVRKSVQHGADEYITKPLRAEELNSIIERVSRRYMKDWQKYPKLIGG
jgi:DNA-binding NtrC family response regulator